MLAVDGFRHRRFMLGPDSHFFGLFPRAVYCSNRILSPVGPTFANVPELWVEFCKRGAFFEGLRTISLFPTCTALASNDFFPSFSITFVILSFTSVFIASLSHRGRGQHENVGSDIFPRYGRFHRCRLTRPDVWIRRHSVEMYLRV